MVEINNQRKAFLDMLARGRREFDNGRRENQKSWLAIIVGGELFTWLWSLCNLSRYLKLKSTGAGRYRKASFPLVGCPPQATGLKDFSPKKSGRSQHCSRLRSVALWLIVVISVRQSNLFTAISGLHCRAGYGQFEHEADGLIAKFKAGGTVGVMYEQSPRLSPLWLSASSSACHGLLIITVITPLPTKPSATKMPEDWSWRTRQLLTCRCVSVMLLRSMQNTRRS